MLLLATILQLAPLLAYAQTNRLFQWKFGNNFLSTTLPTCMTFPIIVQSFNADNSTQGTPPYYMMAFEVGGKPTTSLLGSDPNALTWTVTHAAGTQLMLSVVDANMSAGGIPPSLFDVAMGQTTQCVPPAETTHDFVVTSNITGQVKTCQPWGLSISGGIKPYTVTLAETNQPVVTNVTMGPADDHFTYINRADPNFKMIAAVSDLTGRFAFGTPLVLPVGSTDADCPGLNSKSGTNAEIQAAAYAQEKQQRNSSQRKATIGVATGVSIFFIFGTAGLFYFYWKQKKNRPVRLGESPTLDLEKEGYFSPSDGLTFKAMRSISPQKPPTAALRIQPYSLAIPPAMTASPATSYGAHALAREMHEYGSGGLPSSLPSAISSSTTPSASSRHALPFVGYSSKSAEAAAEAAAAARARQSHSHRPASVIVDADVWAEMLARSGSASSSILQLGQSRRDADLPPLPPDAEVIVQHRDGGGMVRELPPPYIAQSREEA